MSFTKPHAILSQASKRAVAIPELIEMIADKLPCRSDKAHAAQLNKLWQVTVHPSLYQTVYIASHQRHVDPSFASRNKHAKSSLALLDLLSADPGRGQHVYELVTVGVGKQQLSKVLDSCCNLCSLSIEMGILSHLDIMHLRRGRVFEELAHSLRRLEQIFAEHWPLSEELCELFSPLVDLRELRIEGKLEMAQVKAMGSAVGARLETLSVARPIITSQVLLLEDLPGVLRHFPVLRLLELSGRLQIRPLQDMRYLPSTLESLAISDDLPLLCLEVIKHLASPGYLPNLTRTPFLSPSVTKKHAICLAFQTEGLEYLYQADVKTLVERAVEGLRQRPAWSEDVDAIQALYDWRTSFGPHRARGPSVAERREGSPNSPGRSR